MQRAGDMLLGWIMDAPKGRQFFARRLRDFEISIGVETFRASEMACCRACCDLGDFANLHCNAGKFPGRDRLRVSILDDRKSVAKN
jgi:hypothetical protein